ncbi:MAG: MBL fold metallo-hydrolase [Clostridiales bacterium]|nr:MBL fold metallo-hydrolase [Clostridiales bacterium]
MEIITMPVGLQSANSYIIYDQAKGNAAVIDPGGNGEDILNGITSRNLELKYILLTHGHFDHIDAVGWLKDKTGAKVAIHKDDASCLVDSSINLSHSLGRESVQPQADLLLNHGDTIRIGDIELIVIHTPGHSLGSISLLADNAVFTGDTLFRGSIGRTDFLGGSMGQILNSIKNKLLVLDDNTIVYPGHGPKTTIGYEKATNPFLEGLI